MAEDILVVPTGETLLGGHPRTHRTLPTAKNDLAEDASSSVVEKSWHQGWAVYSEKQDSCLSSATWNLCDLGEMSAKCSDLNFYIYKLRAE